LAFGFAYGLARGGRVCHLRCQPPPRAPPPNIGIPLLSNLSDFYTNVSLEIKQKLLGSIFPAKLHFCEDSYRTTPLNPALALILQKKNGFGNEKTRQNLFEETLSGEMPFTDLTSNQFTEGMGKIFELEPFIKIYSMNANREGEKFIQETKVASL
jgi:hypothetical protein